MGTFAGYRAVEVADEEGGVTFPLAIFYPIAAPETEQRLGPYRLALARDAAPGAGPFPLVLISHGSGGSHLAHRTLARHLARNGFVVGMPEHPFNNRNDNSLVDTVENMANRPRHLRAAIDWFFCGEFASHLQPDTVGLIGHSMGGYTALAAADGRATSFPHEAPDRQRHQIAVTPDRRIKALVLLAPAAVWFMAPGALHDVRVPVLLLIGERDEATPPAVHGRIIAEGLPSRAKLRQRIVPNAGHFAFQSIYPAAMASAAFPPAQDPPGSSLNSTRKSSRSWRANFQRMIAIGRDDERTRG